MAQSKDTIQSTLQVDIDLSKVREKVRETTRLEEEADKKADEIKKKARETLEQLEADERRVERAVHKFEHKAIQHPLKNLAKASLGMLAANITPGFEGGEEDPGFLKKVGAAALFGLAGGPEGSAIAVLSVSIEHLIESVKESKREESEIKKRINEAEERRRQDRYDIEQQIRAIEEKRELDGVTFRTRVELFARELDYQTFQLMGNAED